MAITVLYALAALGSWWLAHCATLRLGFMTGRKDPPGSGNYSIPFLILCVCTVLMVTFIYALARQ